MNIERITEKAKQTSKFSELPITAQMSILYPLIIEAKGFGIPHKVICEAMNAAGSNVTLRYFREALKTVRAKYKKQGVIITADTLPMGAKNPPSLQVKPAGEPNATFGSGLSSTQARNNKADQYMNNPSSNAVLSGIKLPEGI
ncbi:hypothetical protein YA0783_24905 [Pseudomonas corrugata]|uniref:hypothetical protein n=1 Tax=Pseudomonas corrugata TaxID=47879 RepID=UPI0018E5B19A|nr:hypothetical protein [Pseudomonas corrugata]MBI6621532.1 hypothetical protein [Pseudomonas corrugata]MBI6694233.1 hypothetical protein [Pseudomonas corrugata]